MKVIHIVENLNKGAVENWLVRMFCYGQELGFNLNWTFFCTENKVGKLDERVILNGGKIIYSNIPLNDKIKFISYLRCELKIGKYDILHCHHDLVSAVYLLASWNLKIKKKIVHVHNADEVIPVSGLIKQNILRFIFRRICWIASDNIVGISNHTLDRFLLNKIRRKNIDIVHYYGVNHKPFINENFNKRDKLIELGIPLNKIIILFIGRIDVAKNPLFAFEVIKNLTSLNNEIIGLFVGQGALENELNSAIKENNLEDKIFHYKWRNDVPEIMRCCDLFISPHVEYPKEGLGLVIVEAQLAQLPLLISTGISDDPLISGAYFKKLKLSEGVIAWAKEAIVMLKLPKHDLVVFHKYFQNSPFEMRYAINDLLKLYND